MELVPLSIREAKRYVAHHHRHNRPPKGAIFALGAQDDAGELVGVVLVGRPVGRGAQDGWTAEVLRCCTDGYPNACSFLYARARRVLVALGYRKCITYTRQDEPGSSLRAAGFEQVALLPARSWGEEREGRTDQSEPFARIRWEMDLTR